MEEMSEAMLEDFCHGVKEVADLEFIAAEGFPTRNIIHTVKTTVKMVVLTKHLYVQYQRPENH